MLADAVSLPYRIKADQRTSARQPITTLLEGYEDLQAEKDKASAAAKVATGA